MNNPGIVFRDIVSKFPRVHQLDDLSTFGHFANLRMQQSLNDSHLWGSQLKNHTTDSQQITWNREYPNEVQS